MIKCADDCPVCCDFCLHFDFNGEPMKSVDGKQTITVYVGKGYCRKKQEPSDPGYYCEDYHCGRAKEATADAQA